MQILHYLPRCLPPVCVTTSIDVRRSILYEEIPRPAVRKPDLYVKEIAAGGEISKYCQCACHKEQTLPN